jgi:hypothetical protein
MGLFRAFRCSVSVMLLTALCFVAPLSANAPRGEGRDDSAATTLPRALRHSVISQVGPPHEAGIAALSPPAGDGVFGALRKSTGAARIVLPPPDRIAFCRSNR